MKEFNNLMIVDDTTYPEAIYLYNIKPHLNNYEFFYEVKGYSTHKIFAYAYRCNKTQLLEDLVSYNKLHKDSPDDYVIVTYAYWPDSSRQIVSLEVF